MAASGFSPSSMFSNMGGGNDLFSGLQQFLGGMFGDSGKPYGDAMKQFQKYFSQARDVQNPFYNAGKGTIPGMQEWLGGMKDPSSFINNLMGKYQESPMAKNLTNAAMRAGTNAASATGTTGSTPFAQQMQQNAGQISSADQNNWLQNVLGINKEYGSGLSGMMGMGQQSADQISKLLESLGMNMGAGAYGQTAGENQDDTNTFGGLLRMLMGGGKMALGFGGL